MTISVHSVSLKGKRPQNEDKHSEIINLDGKNPDILPINFFGVYDGHGGKSISKFLADNLPQCFINKKVSYPLKKNFVKDIYNYWRELLQSKYRDISTTAGSTCLVVIQYKEADKDFLNILNTGDSRCVLCRNGLGIPLTKDHKPNWPEESYRIKKLGGEIVFDGYDYRICNLSVSRAFGDTSAYPYVTNMPDLYRYKLTSNDNFMVLACDGLWDVYSNQDVVNIVLESCYDMTGRTRINQNINIAKKLAELAIAKGSTDNISVIVVFFY
jgi:serine/threonine protein phosphatase PrpC